MKKLMSFLLLMTSFSFLSAQTVENIKVEQAGENLEINYRIGGSTAQQLYFVTLTCSIDNAPVFEPKSVIGDVGSNIRGGKSYNTIVWDVYDDVKEIGSIEFFVKVDLISDQTDTERKELKLGRKNDAFHDNDRKLFLGYGGSIKHPLGARIGYLGNWGAYGSMRYGGKDDPWIDDFGVEIYDELITASVGVTKRIMTWEKLRLHGYTGLGLGEMADELVEGGLIGILGNRVNVNLGMSWNYWYADFTFGLGIVF